MRQVLRIHDEDDLIVALADLPAGAAVSLEPGGQAWNLPRAVPAKHKFAARPLRDGERVRMYGVTVGRAVGDILPGELITTANLTHATDEAVVGLRRIGWTPPDVSRFAGRTFEGYHRSGGGGVGTANHWLVVPLVFCENRNIQVMREAMLEELGYRRGQTYQWQVRGMVEAYRSEAGGGAGAVAETIIAESAKPQAAERVFPGVDGVKFLTHSLGCGGTREDAANLCRLLAAYIAHPNVAGATVLSLGCQNAEVRLLTEALHAIDSSFDKPLHILDQQALGSESTLMDEAIRRTFSGLIEANKARREPAPLSALKIGVKCGGSDGFSGISANPVTGYVADILAALGGTIFLAEFPELAGTEQDLVDRCVNEADARRFLQLMGDYQQRAVAVGSGFDRNPSPGNIADGLITDAMKSAGAVRKGGTSPVTGVLDYAEVARAPGAGLHLVCSPGNDVESTTAMTAAGATVMLFTTGLGTPTGNPICPTLKISTNTPLAERMADIIDFDTGGIIDGTGDVATLGDQLMEQVIETASGRYMPKAVRLGQDDFIPWKRGVSL